MQTKTTSSKNSIVDDLDFTARTLKRVTWESWEFTIVGPYQVHVPNASYGYLMHEHAYIVGIEDRGDRLVPAECECPADIHHDTDCKHRVALAVSGGPLVMQAAAGYENAPVDDAAGIILADRLQESPAALPPEQAPDEPDCDCAGLRDDFPCFDCYRTGRKPLPE